MAATRGGAAARAASAPAGGRTMTIIRTQGRRRAPLGVFVSGTTPGPTGCALAASDRFKLKSPPAARLISNAASGPLRVDEADATVLGRARMLGIVEVGVTAPPDLETRRVDMVFFDQIVTHRLGPML